MSLADHELLELHTLCDALVDGTITETQHTRLEQWLASSEEARRCYVRAMALSASLIDYASEMQTEAPDARPTPPRVVRPAAWIWTIGSLAAAAVLVLAFWLGGSKEREVREELAAAAPENEETVARLSGAKDARWSGAPLAIGEELHPGQRIELASGFTEITFDSGTQITLEGPAVLEVNSAWDAALHRGILKASVPPEAIGFRVANASVNVVDLGTEFTMVADESGATEVFVLKGAVEAAARDHTGEESPAIVLREKQARRFARVGGTEVPDREAKLAKFSRKVAFDRLKQSAHYAHWSFDAEGAEFTAATDSSAGRLELLGDISSANARAIGYRGSGLYFDGQRIAKVELPGIRQRSARSIAFWTKIASDAPLSDGGTIASWPLGGGNRSVAVAWNQNAAQGLLGVLRTDTWRGSIIGSTPVRDGQWHHLAVVFSPKTKGEKDGMQLRQYIDGRLENSFAKHHGKRPKSAEKLTASADGALWIGRAAGRSGAGQFRGTIDELFVADTALSPQEIRHLMRENKPATPEMLAAQ